MFSLTLSSARSRNLAMPKASLLPGNPWHWGKQSVLNFLDSMNPSKSDDRMKVQRQLAVLESAIHSECRGPYAHVEDVLEADPRELPIQLRAYRELYEYILVWLG